MAIVIESDRAPRSFGKIIVWLLILGVILFGAYYLFFKRPDVIPNLAAPSGFQEARQLSGIKLDPDAVVQNPAFQALKPQAPDQPTPETGRTNPFQPI